MVVLVVGFDLRSDPVQPSPVQPGPVLLARPWRPSSPPCAPPSPDLFGSFDFSRAATSLSLFHLSLPVVP
jgi:hypothetical protein